MHLLTLLHHTASNHTSFTSLYDHNLLSASHTDRQHVLSQPAATAHRRRTRAQAFCEKVMQHVRSIPENLEATDEQLAALYTTTEALQEAVHTLEERADAHAAAADAQGDATRDFEARLAAAERGLDVIPAWKHSYEERMRAAGAAAAERTAALEDKHEALQAMHEQGLSRMMERCACCGAMAAARRGVCVCTEDKGMRGHKATAVGREWEAMQV